MNSEVLLEDGLIMFLCTAQSIWNLVIRQKKKKKSLVKNKAIFFTSFLEQWEIDSAFNINSMSGTSSLDS